jgi:WD40 repeat protein
MKLSERVIALACSALLLGGAVAGPTCARAEDAAEARQNTRGVVAGEIAHSFEAHESEVTSARFSPGGDRIITASRDGTARVWSARSGEMRLTLSGHSDAVTAAAFDSEGATALTASRDGTARLWDARNGTPRHTLAGHAGGVSAAAFHPAGTHVVTAGSDGEARVWNVASGETLFRLDGHEDGLTSVSYDPSGAFLLTAGRDGRAIVWSAADGARLAVLDPHPGAVRHAEFSPGGDRVVTTYEDKEIADGTVISADGAARVWAWRDAELLTELTLDDRNRVMTATFSPDGTMVATAGRFGTAQIRDGETGARLLTLGRHFDSVTAVRFGPAGDRLVTASGNGNVLIWKLTR